MTTYFVSRHQGALDWAAAEGVAYDVHLTHLEEAEQLSAGDVVIGTLPVQMIYVLGQLGVRYLHLSVEIPAEQRGKELTAKMLSAYQAQLVTYVVSQP